MAKKKLTKRICDSCHQPYHRRNLVEAWTQVNYGHRAGWIKTVRRLCTYCCNARQAQKVVNVAAVVAVRRRAA